MALTPKQEKFCREVASGKNLSDAYRSAYDCSKTKDNVVNVRACELMAKGNIKVRVKEFSEKIEEKLIYSAVQSFNKLTEIQEKALNNKKVILGRGEENALYVEDPDFTAAVKTEELKGKLAGLYVDKQVLTFGDMAEEDINEVEEALFGDNQE